MQNASSGLSTSTRPSDITGGRADRIADRTEMLVHQPRIETIMSGRDGRVCRENG